MPKPNLSTLVLHTSMHNRRGKAVLARLDVAERVRDDVPDGPRVATVAGREMERNVELKGVNVPHCSRTGGRPVRQREDLVEEDNEAAAVGPVEQLIAQAPRGPVGEDLSHGANVPKALAVQENGQAIRVLSRRGRNTHLDEHLEIRPLNLVCKARGVTSAL